ncbi:uncharacterized protein LOC126898780 isoform X2 [Daktulosphaira vitifoliae]|uniref:uncharacterized protein LOC126898780 isoform X2 n=1 Tax=Daktulosphaira vitifoliae TaxID=58002 RepID=UPI0021AA9BAA|nr:uncharacterized protein LOC126898780 isoform X2 [Daktulosphaira vitifoliae]
MYMGSTDYAEGFIKKIRERLDVESFKHAIKLLGSLSNTDENITSLYQQITEILTNKNEDLIYEFLGFLHPGQALSIGKFSEYLELTRMKEFIRKLQVCMKKQPAQIRRILDNLYKLSKNQNTTHSEVHMIMLPLLKNNPILVDCFLQMIPTEHPPESLFSEDSWEDLDINQSVDYGIDYEEINPSNSEDLTYLNLCHCSCHKDGESSHCRSCGLKFFKGRIYFDTPEGLKLALIKFEGDQNVVLTKIDKLKESVAVKQKNRKCHTKNNSPGSAEDVKGSTGTESEEDLIDIKPKKRQKSKVVQSLKLKFKKEESPKHKEEEELCIENGKSIVHVNNEELNSSEMVFFCIPDSETKVKFTSISEQGSNFEKKKYLELFENTCKDTNESVKEKNDIELENYLSITSDIKMKEENVFVLDPNIATYNNVKKQIKEESSIINIDYSAKSNDNYDVSIKCEYTPEIYNSIILNSDNQEKSNNEHSTNSNNLNINNIKSEHITKICGSNNLELDKPKKDLENQLISKWTIDEDKIILQTCKRVEDIEVLLETINRRIPQRSVNEIQERFTTLMTLLEQMIDVKQT